MGFRYQRLLGSIGLRANLLNAGAGISDRGSWTTVEARVSDSTTEPGSADLSYVVIEHSQKPVQALGPVLLMIVLAVLAFVVAAQG